MNTPETRKAGRQAVIQKEHFPGLQSWGQAPPSTQRSNATGWCPDAMPCAAKFQAHFHTCEAPGGLNLTEESGSATESRMRSAVCRTDSTPHYESNRGPCPPREANIAYFNPNTWLV